MWWILDAGISCPWTVSDTMNLTLWDLWNQRISSSSRRYPRTNLLSSYFATHSLLGLLPLSFASRDSRQANPSSYKFSDGSTTVKTEDGFNVGLGSLLDGWDVYKGTGLRPLAHHVVKVLRDCRISRLEKVPWSVKDTGRRVAFTTLPNYGSGPHRGTKGPFFFVSGPFSHSPVSCFRNSTVFTIFALSTNFVQTTCRPIVKLCPRSRLFLHLVTHPVVRLPFNHLLQCLLQIS